MRIAYNPLYKPDGKTKVGALKSAPINDIVFDLPGKSIWAKGLKFLGTDSLKIIIGSSSDTVAGTWTGQHSEIGRYEDGLTIIYIPKVAGASTTTLNINGLGAKTCYYSGNSKLTTHYPAGTPILFTYYNDGWRRADYDSNYYRPIEVNNTALLGNNNYVLNFKSDGNISYVTTAATSTSKQADLTIGINILTLKNNLGVSTTINSTSTNDLLPTSKSVYDFVGTYLTSYMHWKGNTPSSGTTFTIPNAASVGDAYRIAVAGTLPAANSITGSAQVVEVGDIIICTDTTGPKYTVAQTNWTAVAGTSALAWNSEVTLATIGGLAIKAKLPVNPTLALKSISFTKADGTAISYNGSSTVDLTGGINYATLANLVKNNLIIKWGDTEGTNLFTYNGSTAKTINLSVPFSLLFTSFGNAGNLTTRITIGGVTKDLKIDADTVDGYHANNFYILGRGKINAQVDLLSIPKDVSGGWAVTNSGWDGMVAVLSLGYINSNRGIGFLFKGGQNSRINLLTQVDDTWYDRGIIAYTSDIPTSLKNPYILTFTAGTFAAKTYDGSSAVTVNIPTHTSHLINNSGFLIEHLSLANYVTLNTALTISGIKTFSTLLKFIVAQGTSPFTVTSTTKVDNLNADLLDGYDHTDFIHIQKTNIPNGTGWYRIAETYKNPSYHTANGTFEIFDLSGALPASRTIHTSVTIHRVGLVQINGSQWSNTIIKARIIHQNNSNWNSSTPAYFEIYTVAGNYNLKSWFSGNGWKCYTTATISPEGDTPTSTTEHETLTLTNNGMAANNFSGNASSATKLTSSNGNATLPIYFSDGKPVACTPSSLFSNLSNDGNNLSITIAGLNRTLTVGYASNADKLDGFHEVSFMRSRGRAKESNTLWNSIGILGFGLNDGTTPYKPDGLSSRDNYYWGLVITFPSDTSILELWSNCYSSGNNSYSGLYYRTGWGSRANQLGWLEILDSKNYTAYTVKKDGTGASGTWDININGNATTATKLNQGSGANDDACMPSGGNQFLVFTTSAASGTRGGADGHIMAFTWSGTTAYGAQIYIDTDPSNTMCVRTRNASGVWTAWNTVSYNGHTHSYLPLSGGTITGNLYVNLYLGVNAWSGYGSGTAAAWYNGNSTHLVWDKALEAPAFYASSDIRLKNNINNISKSIRSFNWKESGLKSYGLIAQEIENEYPELVSSNDNGYKSINYTSALCMLVAKLENTVDTLKDRIELLEQQLKMYHGNSK